MTTINYQATKTAAEFHLDNSKVRLLLGPVGCGKSVANCIEIFRRASEQAKGSDGVRRSRWAVIRNTYPELKSTTIKTWQAWFPAEAFGPIKWSAPITHHIILEDIDCEVIFLALDSPNDIHKLMSLELTGAYINELQYIPKAVFDIALQRINRYPAKMMGAPITWTGILSDTNPPDTEHWIYKLFEEHKPDGYKLFKYSSALAIVDERPEGNHCAISLSGTYYVNNSLADYVRCQNDADYWIKLVSGYTDDQIKVYLMGQYGIFVDGRPVHPEYCDAIHFANEELQANPLVEIGLGFDFGLTPACSIVQVLPNGQFVALDELYSDDLFLRDFAEYTVIPHLDLHYPFWRSNYFSCHDPAGETASQSSGESCGQILLELGIRSYPASKNNEPTARRDGLKKFLRRLILGTPGYQLSSKCKRLRKALMGGYHYPRMNVSLDDQYKPKPLKNMYSHIAEAHEYIAMHYGNPLSAVKPAKEPVNIGQNQKTISNLKRAAYARGRFPLSR